MKNLIYVAFFIGCMSESLAQPPIIYQQPYNYSDNLNDANNMLVRYWYYRWRLQNDFLIVGDHRGYSIPAEARMEADKANSIRWGDGTIWLGQYLVMLATENALLRYSNRYYDLLKNERELYYAMQAFNRLDEQSDTYYDAGLSDAGNNTPMPACKNGFFLRDDVPAKFLTTNYLETTFSTGNTSTWNTTLEFNHFNNGKSGIDYYYKPCYTVSCGGLCWPYNASYVPDYNHSYGLMSHRDKNDMDSLNGPHGHNTFAMSQDQVSRLLTGFEAVIRTIPSGITMVDTDEDGYGDTPFDFAEEAKIHCTNIIARSYGMSSNTHDNQTSASCSQLFPGYTWLIFDPLAESPGIGYWAGSIAPMLAMAWYNNYSDNHNIYGLNHAYTSAVHLAVTTPVSPYLMISAVGEVTNQNQGSNAKNFLYAEIASGIYPVWNFSTPLAFAVSNSNLVLNHIYNYSKNDHPNSPEKTFFWHPYMAPLYCYLHNVTPSSSSAISNWVQTRADMTSEVMSAPCVGPYNFVSTGNIPQSDPASLNSHYETAYGSGIPAAGKNGWSTEFRFDQRQLKTINGYEYNDDNVRTADNGFYNGIDYMSLVNLYYVTSTVIPNGSQELFPFYHNLIDRYVDYDVSSDNTPMLGGFNSITLTKNVTGSAPLDIQAGEYIHLQDGTHITTSNASKHLYIKTFSCSDFNTSGYQRSANSDSTSVSTNPTRPMNNDYGFNEIFPQMHYDVHSYARNNLSAENVVNSIESVELNQIQDDDSLVLYPNPTTHFFSIKNVQTEKAVNCSLQLLGMDGKSISIEQKREGYDIFPLAPGTYIIKLIFPSGVIETKKLIKLP